MLPVVMGPHTVGKASQPSFSIKGRSKLGSFSDDLHKARAPCQDAGLFMPQRWPLWPLPPGPSPPRMKPVSSSSSGCLPHAWHRPAPPNTHTRLQSRDEEGQTRDKGADSNSAEEG